MFRGVLGLEDLFELLGNVLFVVIVFGCVFIGLFKNVD